ncbi:hypothetical protein C8Q76DRAFT_830755 [Earliella scabrosa]|nr:hypothetical protein C8Q76DRAFT_830755 [Earliella scabrosa]
MRSLITESLRLFNHLCASGLHQHCQLLIIHIQVVLPLNRRQSPLVPFRCHSSTMFRIKTNKVIQEQPEAYIRNEINLMTAAHQHVSEVAEEIKTLAEERPFIVICTGPAKVDKLSLDDREVSQRAVPVSQDVLDNVFHLVRQWKDKITLHSTSPIYFWARDFFVVPSDTSKYAEIVKHMFQNCHACFVLPFGFTQLGSPSVEPSTLLSRSYTWLELGSLNREVRLDRPGERLMVILDTRSVSGSVMIPRGEPQAQIIMRDGVHAIPLRYLLIGQIEAAIRDARRGPPAEKMDANVSERTAPGIFGSLVNASTGAHIRTLDYYRAVACLEALSPNTSAIGRAGAKWLGLCWSGVEPTKLLEARDSFVAICTQLLSLDPMRFPSMNSKLLHARMSSSCHLAAQMTKKFEHSPAWFTIGLSNLPPDPVFSLFPKPCHISVLKQDPATGMWESFYKVHTYLDAAYKKSRTFHNLHWTYGPLWPLMLPDGQVVPPSPFSVTFFEDFQPKQQSKQSKTEMFILKARATPLKALPTQANQTRVKLYCVNNPHEAWETRACPDDHSAGSVEGDECICRQSEAWIVNLGKYTIDRSQQSTGDEQPPLHIQRGGHTTTRVVDSSSGQRVL